MQRRHWAFRSLIACVGIAVHGPPISAQPGSGAVAAVRVTPHQLHRILDSARVAAKLPVCHDLRR